MAGDLNALKIQYEREKPLYEQFCEEIEVQLSELLRQEGIALALQIEYRVKSWQSIADKCTQRPMIPDTLAEIGDIAGLRVVPLFKRDREKVCSIVLANFEVIKTEDTQDRLSADQFGYGSVHFEVRPRQEWFSLPTLSRLRGLQAEIQVRTASQHIWAAASHALQYKRESHVPKPVLRTINRVAALLEMVDLEFERVLSERASYVAQLDEREGDEPLNTDILQKIIAEEFPPENSDESNEDLSELLDELADFGILSAMSLRQLIKRQRKAIFSAEAKALEEVRQKKGKGLYEMDPKRFASGVFFTHGGLVRQALRAEYGEKYDNYRQERYSELVKLAQEHAERAKTQTQPQH